MFPAPDLPSQPVPLLVRVGTGDADAMRECVARYGALVWSIARSFESADAEDAVQAILRDLWKSASRFEPAASSETAFVVLIARRRLIDRKRGRRRRPTTDGGPQPERRPAAASGVPETCDEAARAARVLERLRPEQRQVLVLAACQGMSHDEIATETGMPLSAVKQHARRGLTSIRDALLGVDQGPTS
jgi:RNA polymerase sigma-70 factor (ECF subfamily)